MGLYGDPAELDRIANDITAQAAQVREHADELDRAAKSMRWKSAAADRCRAVLDDDRTKLEQAAQRMDEAAAKLRRHAQEIRQMVARIDEIAHKVTGWFSTALHDLENAAGKVVGEVGGALGIGGSSSAPPWAGWHYGPNSLPPPGHKEWLEVGKFMSAKGVL
jgi:predicted  nucleic acid-binding Zn-ribbon protein